MTRLMLTLAVLSFAVAPFALAAPAVAAPPKGCTSPQDRQFDFWAGRWNVTDNASGKRVGTNDVTREYGGCVLHEHWAGTGGDQGSSFNHYDAARKVWHQTWVDNSGGILYLDGGLQAGSMVLAGRRRGRGGAWVTDRITYTRRPDGSVRQWWQASRNGGATWKTVFDGIYRRS